MPPESAVPWRVGGDSEVIAIPSFSGWWISSNPVSSRGPETALVGSSRRTAIRLDATLAYRRWLRSSPIQADQRPDFYSFEDSAYYRLGFRRATKLLQVL
jgi:hypothetical protein